MPVGRDAMFWNPATFNYEAATTGAGPLEQSMFGSQFALDAPIARQWASAAGAAVPGYTQRALNPYARRAVERLYDPLYGEFVAASDPLADYSTDPIQTFAQYAGGRLGTPSNIGQTTPGNWQDILNLARYQGIGYTGDSLENLGLAGTQAAVNRSIRAASALEDPAALTGLATYDPRYAGEAGRMRQNALTRLSEQFAAGTMQDPQGRYIGGPASSTADWLAYITDPTASGLNVVRPELQYGYTAPA
jgi:hypothetical protein